MRTVLSPQLRAAAEIEVLGPENPIRRCVPALGLAKQPGHHPVGHQGSGLPPVRLQSRVQVSELLLETSFASSPPSWRAPISLHDGS
jgi:hypothetical protein